MKGLFIRRVSKVFFAAFFVVSIPSLCARTDIREVISPGGIRAWFIPEKKLPVFSITFSFRGGYAHDPSNSEGMAVLLASMMTEGTQRQTGDELKNTLLEKAIQLGVSATADRFVFYMRTSLENLKDARNLLKEILYTPRLDEKDLERIRTGLIASINHTMKMTETLAEVKHGQVLMGTHPYGRFPDGNPEHIQKLTPDDLKARHKALLGKDSLVIGVCGNISQTELGDLLDDVFGYLPAKGTIPDLETPSPDFSAGMSVIPSANPQAAVVFSHPGLQHSHPDFMKLYLLTNIMGAGPTSRLFEEIREKQGLAYAVNAQLAWYEKIQLLSGEMGSENSKVRNAVEIIRKIWRDVRRNGVTQSELDKAKNTLIGVFPLGFTSSQQIASALHSYQVFGLKTSYIANRTGIIRAVSLKEINDFAKKFIDPDKLVFTIAGNTGNPGQK